MKLLPKLSLGASFFLLLGLASPAQAQVNININPPSWGPAVGPNTQYYYIPEVDGYYDVRDQQYVVLRNGQWARLANPGYDPRSFHPVVIDYVGAQPWVRIEEYRTKYKGHPHGMPPGQAKKYYGNQGNQGNGRGNGHGNGKGRGKH
ncbi:hypothetical protein [Hymenobacter persicinus]|uniref:Uncharacterized protein n=1 Tax=Hymenobacter persicinus TaxID=2025506 RepID=A0A4V1ZAT9_9BACT|nr:hypothetical protein [Hymenobacter persicinus]RYU80073.1 hypothetical protein EWM57_09015 [Hymenobacter persicinus]